MRIRSESRTERRRQGERGAVLVVVLTMMLLFVAAGGAAVLTTRALGAYAKNREWTMQATAAAEAALHWAVTQMMASADDPDTPEPDYNTAPFSDLELEPGYAPRADGIIEATGSATEFRIYARGRAGTNWATGRPVTKYIRAYVRLNGRGTSGTVRLLDWQEIPEAVVRDHWLALPEADPNKDDFGNWFS